MPVPPSRSALGARPAPAWWRPGGRHLVGDPQVPAGRLAGLLDPDPEVRGGKGQLAGVRVQPEDAQVDDDSNYQVRVGSRDGPARTARRCGRIAGAKQL